MDSTQKCNICLKSEEIIKCNTCTFVSCEKCILRWFENTLCRCPQCKNTKTYPGIDYSEWLDVEDEEEDIIHTDQVLISSFANLSVDIINEFLHDGQVFASDNFIENYQQWPEVIRSKWSWHPITMDIDGQEEIIAYSIMRTS